MKKHLAHLSIVLMPLVAHAGDISSMKYFGKEGGSTFDAKIETSLKHEVTNFDSVGNIKQSTDKYKGFMLDLGYAYGLSKNMSLGINSKWNLLSSRYETTPASGSTTAATTRLTKGFSDPTINFKYRYMEGSDWTADAFINWDLELKKKTVSTQSNTGNVFTVKDTGQTFRFGTSLYQDMMGGEFGITPNFSYSFGSEYQKIDNTLTAGSKTTEAYKGDSSFGYGLNANYRRHYDKMFADVGASIMAEQKYTATVNNTTTEVNGNATTTNITNTTTEAKYPWRVSPKVMLGYMLSESSVADLTLGYSSYIYDNTTTANNARSSKTNHTNNEWSVNVGYTTHM